MEEVHPEIVNRKLKEEEQKGLRQQQKSFITLSKTKPPTAASAKLLGLSNQLKLHRVMVR